MAAITYKFGVQSDVSPVDSASAEMTPRQAEAGGGLMGLGQGYSESDLGVDFADQLSVDIVNATHSGLEDMTWLRRAVEEALQGRGFRVEFEGREVKLVLLKPAPMIPAWNPPTSEELQRFSVLSWTSKMGTPSFSLPAGAPVMGGSCPGAAAGQTIVPVETLQRNAREVRSILGAPVRLVQAICQHCYAEGGQYSTALVQYAQVLRYAWTKEAVRDGSFSQIMDWAIKHADFALKDTVRKLEDGTTVPVRGERDGKKYFRLHDSGDFWSPEYIAAWKVVANLNPDVTFWAPSRVWANAKLREAVNLYNSMPPPGRAMNNLVIRPSAYHVNEAPPKNLGPGWAAGSTSFKDTLKPSQAPRLNLQAPYQWDCQAYTTDSDKVTCRDAMPPGGMSDADRGCRACWKYGQQDERGNTPGLTVNYTLH